jgi:hypothetical protein
VLHSLGAPLDPESLAFLEPHFGYDFSRVRIHADARAGEAANAVQAQAFTLGRDIVFGSGRFAPSTTEGRKLLAHELTHVVQQGAAPAVEAHAPEAPGDRGRGANELRTSCVSEPGRLQRQAAGGKDSLKAEACPPMQPGEKEESAKAPLQMMETIPGSEWLIYGFPIGGSEMAQADAARFIHDIVANLMRGHMVYMVGQDSLDVRGFSDCFSGPQVDNDALRQLRAAKFCAGVKGHYASTPNTYPKLIHSCEPAPAGQYVGSNATPADRAKNRSIVIRRVAGEKAQAQEGKQSFPYDAKYGPSEAHCAAYSTDLARQVLGRVYTQNAHCSCLVTPDEPHNNCVRNCLQDKMWTFLASAKRERKLGDPPMDINFVCPIIWQHHRECYHDCGCASEFIDYLAFDGVCNVPLPCPADSAAINVLNRCMPATRDDKHLPTP